MGAVNLSEKVLDRKLAELRRQHPDDYIEISYAPCPRIGRFMATRFRRMN